MDYLNDINKTLSIIQSVAYTMGACADRGDLPEEVASDGFLLLRELAAVMQAHTSETGCAV